MIVRNRYGFPPYKLFVHRRHASNSGVARWYSQLALSLNNVMTPERFPYKSRRRRLWVRLIMRLMNNRYIVWYGE